MDFTKRLGQVGSSNSLQKKQIDFLNKFVFGSWKFIDGFVDVDGDFHWINEWGKDFKGIRFGKVTGNFNCYDNLLTSLEGCPQIVYGDFSCSGNGLSSLARAPQRVDGHFYCSSNRLTSLSGCTQKIGKDIHCYNNLLTSLAGSPQEVGGNFLCGGNNLISLEGFPRYVDGNFRGYNNLVSEETFQLLWNKLKEIPIYSIALASIWSKIPEKDQELMKKDLDPDYLDYSQLSDFGLI